MAPWVTPLPGVSSTTRYLAAADNPFERGGMSGIGQRSHDCVDTGCFSHPRCISHAHQLTDSCVNVLCIK